MFDLWTRQKTLRRQHVPGAVVFVTATTRCRHPFFADPTHAATAVGSVAQVQDRGLWGALAFAIMPDHVHLLVHLRRDATISQAMTHYKWRAAASIRAAQGPGRVWEERFYDRTIRREEELTQVVEYIQWNPVKAEFCDQPEDFAYCSAHPDYIDACELLINQALGGGSLTADDPSSTSTWNPNEADRLE